MPAKRAALQDLTKDPLEAQRAKEWFSNWVSKPLANEKDAQDGIALLRESYEELTIS